VSVVFQAELEAQKSAAQTCLVLLHLAQLAAWSTELHEPGHLEDRQDVTFSEAQ